MMRMLRRKMSAPMLMESLEDRVLLSHGKGHAYAFGQYKDHGNKHKEDHPKPPPITVCQHANGPSIAFSAAPASVQAGLNTLAASDGLTPPGPDDLVTLGNKNGVETYAITITGVGTTTTLTVDAAGVAYTDPVKSTTTYGAINNAAVTNEVAVIAAALGTLVPDPSTTVNVVTDYKGNAVYSIKLATANKCGTTVSIDAAGNPVGNMKLPASTIPTAAQNALNANAPVGATPLQPSDLVTITTAFGKTTYTAKFTATGIVTKVTVDANGTLTNGPSTTKVAFSTTPAAAQTALQALATAAGFTGTIDPTQNTSAFDEANGTVLYSVRLPVTITKQDGTTCTVQKVFTVDQLGNATVLPSMFCGFGH